jgi:RNA polymerase sigma-70 factor (ECF subfamily)
MTDHDGRFRTTRWNLILSATGNGAEDQAREALSHLCRIYRRPVFAFICRRGGSAEEAQDLTQDFFIMVATGDILQRADRARGRFRALLRTSLDNFLRDADRKSRTRKRGGDFRFVSWDDWMAEAPSQLTVPLAALESWPAEKIFDVRWAATVAERALARLQEECARRNRQRVFDALSGALMVERNEVSYDRLARDLGADSLEVKHVLRRLRQRFRQVLREEVAATVVDPADVDDELRHLVAALAAGSKLPNE